MKKIITFLVVAVVALSAANSAFAQKEDIMAHEKQITTMTKFVSMLDSYLKVSEKWMQMVSDEKMTVYFVAEGIKEIYEEQGKIEKAIPEFQKLLKTYDSKPAIKRMLLFKIRDIYKDTGQFDEALKTLKQIIEIK